MTLQDTLNKSYKPFDIVTDEHGNVGIIREVSVIQPLDKDGAARISYAVSWLIGDSYTAWHDQERLTQHANVMAVIAEAMCHNSGHNGQHIKALFNLK